MNAVMIYLVILLMLPILEIAVFIQVGSEIGVANTLFATVLTAIIGVMLLRFQGFRTFARARRKVDQGHSPLAEMFDALCLFMAGLMLLIPGFVTDAFGLLLFLPPFRNLLRGRINDIPSAFFVHTEFKTTADPRKPDDRTDPQNRRGPKVIEGEYTDLTDKDDRSQS